MELGKAQRIAAEVVKVLAPYCSRIEVAGSIRRRKPLVNDIDIVLIPSDPWNLTGEIARLGAVTAHGAKIQRVQHQGAWIDLYMATPETWATLLLIRTGSKENNIRLCSLAKRKGWHLFADGSGLFNENGSRVAGDSEKSIYEALGLLYQDPWER